MRLALDQPRARWRALPTWARWAIVALPLLVVVLLLVRALGAASLVPVGLLVPLLKRQSSRARAAADEARADTTKLEARTRDAQRRADARAALASARQRVFDAGLRAELDDAGDDAEARAARRLGR